MSRQAGALAVGAVVLCGGLAALLAALVVHAGHPPRASARPAVRAVRSAGAGAPAGTALPATTASRAAAAPAPPAVVSVRGSDGRALSAAGVVSFTGIAREGDTLVLSGLAVLGGRVTAERVVVPDHGFDDARVEGLRVDGTPRPVGENLVYGLGGGGYVVVLQEAVAGGHEGLVGLRVHVDAGLARGEGGDVLVGVPAGRAGRPATVLALSAAPAPVLASGFSYPLASRGVVVGCPFVPGSTHSPSALPDNLASDNAVDLAVPIGTPVLAVADGRIGSLIGPLDSGDPHLAGERVHLDTATDHFYYAHLSRIDVRPGESVRRGQRIGLSGEAAGVAHLHFAQDLGDPAVTVGERRACPARPRPAEPWG